MVEKAAKRKPVLPASICGEELHEDRLHVLKDPCNDRKVPEVPRLVHSAMDDGEFWVKPGLPDWKLLEQHLYREGPITKSQIMDILRLTLATVKKEPNLLHVEEPVVIVGDIHGQYQDLIHMMRKAGDP